MRPRLPSPGFPILGFLIAFASAPPALAQSTIPGTWSTDPSCSARALRVTFGASTLTIERNGRLIYRGAAAMAVTDTAITVRLTPPGEPSGDPGRNVIRFSRAGDAIRMVAATPADGATQHPRVPPLYPCRAAATEAGLPVQSSSATGAAPAVPAR